MSRSYYEMRDSKVSIAHALMGLGWKVYDYKADESDSMTDYYSPANWGGIATKNGYILVIDNKYNSNSGKEITKYNPAGNLSLDDRNKIEKLQSMTTERGATEAEETTAKAAIEKIQNKISGISAYEVIDTYPEYMGNPGRSKWHIEKDGKIFDKGTGLTKFSELERRWMFDYNTLEYKEGYKKVNQWNSELGDSERVDRVPTDELIKLTKAFNNLIKRFENVVAGVTMTGDGTEETEKEGLKAESRRGYKKAIKKEKKTSLKMVGVNRDYILVGDYLTFPHHGHYWKVTSEYMQKGMWKGVEESKQAFVYEIVGAESRGYQQLKNPKRYYDYEFRMLKSLEEGKVKIFELKEVTEIIEVEKWEKIDKTTYNSNQETAPEKKEESQEAITINNTNQFTIEQRQHTKTNENIWVCKLVNTVSKEEFKSILIDIKKKGGYYSKFVGGFVFNFDPTELLNNNSEEVTTDREETPTKTIKKSKVNIKEIADEIESESTDLILELNLNSYTYPNNHEYRRLLTEYINKHNIDITDELLKIIEIEGLKTTLESIRNEIELLKVG